MWADRLLDGPMTLWRQQDRSGRERQIVDLDGERLERRMPNGGRKRAEEEEEEKLSRKKNDGKRPDAKTLMPWEMGRPLVWDATCVDTLAPSHLPSTANRAAADSAECLKRRKYVGISSAYIFEPSRTPLRDRGLDSRSESFLMQKALSPFNAERASVEPTRRCCCLDQLLEVLREERRQQRPQAVQDVSPRCCQNRHDQQHPHAYEGFLVYGPAPDPRPPSGTCLTASEETIGYRLFSRSRNEQKI
ncbi:hypothetical protein MSG28_007216 [Choristoneura fumiferana]|uniref:Uncharacterized protein n=1 Tax=Choristoneura fumiferana TaxID=7141 RepID=A0ACC0JMR4_CHOFU|nr:hypothetical protein MSG28_007216 [Choristoneura fumiferana]